MPRKPRLNEVAQAAELLGVSLFDLGHALRNQAHSRFMAESDKVRQCEDPNFGDARAMLWAAEACEAADAEDLKAALEAVEA